MKSLAELPKEIADFLAKLVGTKTFTRGDWTVIVDYNHDSGQLSVNVLWKNKPIDSQTLWPLNLMEALGASSNLIAMVENLIKWLPTIVKDAALVAEVLAHVGGLSGALTAISVLA